MEIILEAILYIFSEILGQAILELLAELGIRSISNALGRQKPQNPILAMIGYVLLAALGSGISLLVFKEHFLKNNNLRIANLLITPIVVGLFMKYRREKLEAKYINPIRINTFWYGFLFAFTFTLIRFFYAR